MVDGLLFRMRPEVVLLPFKVVIFQFGPIRHVALKILAGATAARRRNQASLSLKNIALRYFLKRGLLSHT